MTPMVDLPDPTRICQIGKLYVIPRHYTFVWETRFSADVGHNCILDRFGNPLTRISQEEMAWAAHEAKLWADDTKEQVRYLKPGAIVLVLKDDSPYKYGRTVNILTPDGFCGWIRNPVSYNKDDPNWLLPV